MPWRLMLVLVDGEEDIAVALYRKGLLMPFLCLIGLQEGGACTDPHGPGVFMGTVGIPAL